MKRLHRPEEEPACLAKLRAENKEWSYRNPKSKDKILIWRKITEMQGEFCCYCEKSIKKGDRHIEHFFPKGNNPDAAENFEHLTYGWENLFGSCGESSGAHCGHFKDMQGKKGPGKYNPRALIKPDAKNPFDYFYVTPFGEIKPRNENEDENIPNARTTIRVLNLSCDQLIEARKKQIKIFQDELEYLYKNTNNLEILTHAITKLKNRILQAEFRTSVMYVLFNEII